MRVLSVVGTRPNLMKVAPLARALESCPGVEHVLVHTGQHYDANMSQVFFDDLGLPAPQVNLEVGSGTHAWQIGQVMLRFEPTLGQYKPDWVVVVGDVNSTLACALVCAKLGVRVAHVEAGLRSFDRTMPEEINRVLTDQVSDLLFTTEVSAHANLADEGIDRCKVHFVGNVMIDTLIRLLPAAASRPILDRLDLSRSKGDVRRYLLVTLHRPQNVDDSQNLEILVDSLSDLAQRTVVVFPVHPRTRRRLEDQGLVGKLSGIRLLAPLGYLDFLALEHRAALVLTDSGGVQEETTYLGVPCLTVRPNTERPVTITHGTNRLVSCDQARIVAETAAVLAGLPRHTPSPPPLWDGHAAERIVEVLLSRAGPR